MYATIDDLRSQLGAKPRSSATESYAEKMLHRVPAAPVVEREKFILEHCKGKRVLEFGASGLLHQAIIKVSASVVGVDRQPSDGVIGFDLDDVSKSDLPTMEPASEVIICGELLEHLGNPLWFLTRLHRQFSGTPTLITVPNAFGTAAGKSIVTGIENVNRDHVAWYSFTTLKCLIGRAGYTECWFGWYRGSPLTAEGLIMVVQ